jgi:hypothetical protein
MIFLRIIIPLRVLVLRVIFSENRFPLFGITREQPRDGERRAAGAAADVEHATSRSRGNRFDQQVLERF